MIVIYASNGGFPMKRAVLYLRVVANPINRYSISPRQNLKSNPDGSIDLYIQKDSPGSDKESNWLPAPAGKFILMLRMYWPHESDPSILDGTWTPPAVKKVA